MAENAFNAYELLEMPPSHIDQQQAIKFLDEKVKAVSRGSGTLSGQADAQRNKIKSHAKEIRAVLEDEAQRLAHARAYGEMLERRRRSAMPLLDVWRTRGWYEPGELAGVAVLTKLPETEILDLVKQAGIPEKPQTSAPPNPLLEATPDNEAETLKQHLLAANADTLYRFMGPDFGPGSDEKTIRRWYDEARVLNGKKASGTPERNRDTALLGDINTHLLDPEKRRKYDNLIVNSTLTSLDKVIGIAGRDKVITAEALSSILRAAKARGVAEKDAMAFVEYWVHKTKGWSIHRPTDRKPPEPVMLCGFCKSVAAPGQTRCHCGRELIVACPSCSRRNPTDRKACECGFPIGDLAIIEKELNSAKADLAADRLGPASAAAKQILVTWPAFAPASDVLQKVAVRQKQLDAERDARQARVRHAEELAANRNFLAAAALLREISAQQPSAVPADLAKRIAARVAESYGLLEKGRAAERAGDLVAAVGAMQAAVAGCADLEEAKSALRRFPPPSVARLSASLLATCVRLQWEPAPGGDLYYIVRRKEGGSPSSATDGEMVGETTGSRLDDIAAAEGRAWHYAVITVRGQVAHSRPAVAGPVLRAGKPIIHRAVAARGVARIEVVPPFGCDRVEASRTPPGGAISRTGNEFVESGLKNGATITYTFQAIYRNPAGGPPIKGDAVAVSLSPEEIPEPIINFKLAATETMVSMSWERPRVGRVALRALDREPTDLSVGLEIDSAKLASIGQEIPIVGQSSTQMPLPIAGRLVIVPFTVDGSIAVVGALGQVNCISEVANLTARPAGVGRIDFQWDWPKGVTTAVVTIYSDAAAAVPIRALTITRQVYDRAGGLAQMDYGAAAPLAARVACVSSCGSFQSNGAMCPMGFGRRGSVNYRIDNGATLRRAIARIAQGRTIDPVLVVESRECNRIRDVVLVGLPTRLPVSVDDGEVVMEIPNIELIDGRAEVGLAAARLRQPLYVKAFIKKPELQPQVRLQPAAKEQLLLKPG